MKVHCLILFCVFLNIFNTATAQTARNYKLQFHPVFQGRSLHIEDSFYKMNSTDSIQFTRCRFYISGIRFLKRGKTVFKEANSFHLIDASEIESLQLTFNLPKGISFDQIDFNVGIDSMTNVAGAMGGDLDPVKGMYWTWQNGYINIKLEGRSNVCKTRNNEFEFHLGGYSQYPTCKSVLLNVKQTKSINIQVDITKFINNINLSQQHHMMTPGKEAVILSEKFVKAFSIVQP